MNQIMKTCRDCKYGVIGLKSGVVSCLKFKELFFPEEANGCEFYDSISVKESTWKQIGVRV